MKEHVIYRDIDLSLTPHPLTGDIAVKTNEAAIERSIKTLFQMEKWDVPFSSKHHSHLKETLFELPTVVSGATVKSRIEWLIQTYEPRVTVSNVVVELVANESAYSITVEYYINSLDINGRVDYTITRIR